LTKFVLYMRFGVSLTRLYIYFKTIMVKFERIDESTVSGKPVMFTRYDESSTPVQIDLATANTAIRVPLAKCKHIYTMAAWGINPKKVTNDFDTHNLFFDLSGKLTAQVQRARDNTYQIERGKVDVTREPFFFCSPDQGIRGKQDRSARQVVNGKSLFFCNAEYAEIYMPSHDVVAVGLLDWDSGRDTFAEYNPIANILISNTDYSLRDLWESVPNSKTKSGFLSNLFGQSQTETINTLEPKPGEQRLTVSFDDASVQGDFMIFSLFIRNGDFVDIISVNKVYRNEKEAIADVKKMVKEYRNV
jgi:hypothetical protein